MLGLSEGQKNSQKWVQNRREKNYHCFFLGHPVVVFVVAVVVVVVAFVFFVGVVVVVVLAVFLVVSPSTIARSPCSKERVA